MLTARLTIVLLIAIFLITIVSANELQDPWLFLEEIDGINALAWVDGQNQRTSKELRVHHIALNREHGNAC